MHSPSVQRAGKRPRTAHWKFLLLVGGVLLLSAALTRALQCWLPFEPRRIFHRTASILGLLGIVVMRRLVDRRSIASLGLEPRRYAAGDLLTGARLGVVTLWALMAVLWWCGVWHVAVNPDQRKLWWSLVTCVPAALLIGCVEEFVFRGYVLRTLLEEYSVRTALLLTSVGYAVAHLGKPMAVWPSMWTDVVGLFVFGVVLACAALRTNLLYLSIGLHASLVYLVKSQKHLLVFDGGSPRWLFGNERLLTGMAGWLALALLGWWVWRVTQGRAPRGQ